MRRRRSVLGKVASTLREVLYRLNELSTQLPAITRTKAAQLSPITISTSRKSSFASRSAASPPAIITMGCTAR